VYQRWDPESGVTALAFLLLLRSFVCLEEEETVVSVRREEN
jgi:hypothetical protein